MSESKLIKDWKSSDVQRMRNLLTNNSNNTTKSQIGYNKKHINYEEGSVWEEHGKQWTIKNGIKQTTTKLDNIKKILQLPLVCPLCHSPVKSHKLNKIMYFIHNKCADCVIKHETELKRLGKFEEYQQNINKQSIVYHVKEMENILLELSMNQSDESFVTEAGDIETWKGKGSNTEQLIQDIQEYIINLKETINS